MSFGAPAGPDQQPDAFSFAPEFRARADAIVARYPEGRQASAVIALLDLAQRQNDNWLPRAAMDHVAELLDMPRIRVYEVASFYTMFNKAPVGRHHVQVCTTTPCWLRGSDRVLQALADKAGARSGHTSDDGQFTVTEVECLGACVNAPMVQIGDDYFEDLDYDRMAEIIEMLRRGEMPAKGSQTGRCGSQAHSGPTSLLALRTNGAAAAAVPPTEPAPTVPESAVPASTAPASTADSTVAEAAPAVAEPEPAPPADAQAAEPAPATADAGDDANSAPPAKPAKSASARKTGAAKAAAGKTAGAKAKSPASKAAAGKTAPKRAPRKKAAESENTEASAGSSDASNAGADGGSKAED